MSTELVVSNGQPQSNKAKTLALLGITDNGKGFAAQLTAHYKSKGLKGNQLSEQVLKVMKGDVDTFIGMTEAQALKDGFIRDLRELAPFKDGRRRFSVSYYEPKQPKGAAPKAIVMTQEQVDDYAKAKGISAEALKAIFDLGFIKLAEPEAREVELVNV